MPNPDPVENLRRIFEEATKIILKFFPSFAVGIVALFVAIIFFLLWLFQGVNIAP